MNDLSTDMRDAECFQTMSQIFGSVIVVLKNKKKVNIVFANLKKFFFMISSQTRLPIHKIQF